MSLRLVKVFDEHQALICLSEKIWGSNKNRFGKWLQGSKLAFLVDKTLVALAEVDGSGFFSNDMFWENDLYPYRIPIKFSHYLFHKKISFPGEFEYFQNLGFAIVTQTPVPIETEKKIIQEFDNTSNDLTFVQNNIEKLSKESLVNRPKDSKT